MSDVDVFQLWVLAACLLSAKVLVLAAATAGVRNGQGQSLNPEDDGTTVDIDTERAGRLFRAHRNSLESVPLFLVLSLAWVGTGPGLGLAWGVLGVFTAARYLHTAFYLAHMSKPRTGAFAVGWLTTFVMLGHLGWTTLAG